MNTARTRVRMVGGAAGVAAGIAVLTIPSGLVARAGASGVPAEFGAAAEGKAIHQNYNVVASLDPALAASRSTAQVSPSGALPKQLSSYGYSNDPGTLAGAVLFAPGNPTTPANFPGLAEAFFPRPDQEHVAKCAFNNDASDTARSGVCDQTRTNTEYSLADVAPNNPLGASALGFASVAGETFGHGFPLVANHVTSESQVAPDKEGRLAVLQENKGSDITIPGTPLTIASFEASAHLLSTAGTVTGDATCAIDMVIAGQHVAVSQVQAALNSLPPPPAGGPLVYSFSPPTKPTVTADNIGGAASCTGAVLEISNPTTGNSVSYTFGETKAQAAKLGQTLSGAGSSAPAASDNSPAASAPTDSGLPSGTPAAAPSSSDVVSTTPTGSTATLSAPPAATPSAPAAGGAPGQASLGRMITKKVSAVPIGIVTAVGATSILLGAWALVGAVGAIAKASGSPLAIR